MIIDCHGHYTTAPDALGAYRDAQRATLKEDPTHQFDKGMIHITDDQIRESIINNQLKLQQERGTDVTIFSPRASWMGHDLGNASTSLAWTEQCNDLIKRVCDLFPENFVPVCQLPQSPTITMENSIRELERCVLEMGFIGCNLNPDPSGGYWKDKPMGDAFWYPFYEKMVELDVPAMIHVSGACHPCMHTTSSYYLGADTTAFVHLMMSDVLKDFPTIKFIIPHGGGAVPYHWGRFRGIAQDMGLGDLDERMLNNIYFDTCVYHQDGIDMLLDVIPTKNILFASEMIGAVRGIDPRTGHYYDDTKRYIDGNTKLTDEQRTAIFEGNIQRVFPRLAI
jgi:4-oxalmesaconate hydratase